MWRWVMKGESERENRGEVWEGMGGIRKQLSFNYNTCTGHHVHIQTVQTCTCTCTCLYIAPLVCLLSAPVPFAYKVFHSWANSELLPLSVYCSISHKYMYMYMYTCNVHCISQYISLYVHTLDVVYSLLIFSILLVYYYVILLCQYLPGTTTTMYHDIKMENGKGTHPGDRGVMLPGKVSFTHTASI